MKIILAQTAGFCMGVKRAVDLALEHAGKTSNNLYTLGPLIHNNQTLDILKDRGVNTLNGAKPAPHGATILIRAHGVPKEVQSSYQKAGHTIVDGTCPKVKTVHRVIEKYRDMGYAIVITGDEGHAEVIGLQGYAGNTGHLISDPDDVGRLPRLEKICLVSQTTFDKTTFDLVARKIIDRFGADNVVIKKTICSATDQRQNETRELAGRVDAMIVVGGKNSANTMRLARIAAEVCGGQVQHVETETEINWEPLALCKTIGITAGASTPNWMIKRVFDYLQFMDQTRKKSAANLFRSVYDFCANLNVFVSCGAVFMYYASCVVQGLGPTFSGAFILFLYFFSMYLWNNLASIESTRHLGLGRYRFYHSRKSTLYAVAASTIVLLLAISSMFSRYLLYLMLFSVVAGSVYHITIVPRFLRTITRYKSLKDVPTSRDLFVALSWGILITFIPQVMSGTMALSPPTWFCFAIIFILAFLRSLIFDLRDIEGDRIMGRETLVTIIGEPRVKKAIHMAILVALAGIVLLPLVSARFHGLVSVPAYFVQAIPLTYLFIFMLWNKNNRASRSPYFNILADAQFYLSGACSWIATMVCL